MHRLLVDVASDLGTKSWQPEPDFLITVKEFDLPILAIEFDSSINHADEARLLVQFSAYIRLWSNLEIEDTKLVAVYITQEGKYIEYSYAVKGKLKNLVCATH